mmetsp:Transcript_22472/g.67307  ORF Transcript_22472/g.67307 Transcript_22472/m.67307 type:complete len:223 (+) Transcript_22472:3599-4267(+)
MAARGTSLVVNPPKVYGLASWSTRQTLSASHHYQGASRLAPRPTTSRAHCGLTVASSVSQSAKMPTGDSSSAGTVAIARSFATRAPSSEQAIRDRRNARSIRTSRGHISRRCRRAARFARRRTAKMASLTCRNASTRAWRTTPRAGASLGAHPDWRRCLGPPPLSARPPSVLPGRQPHSGSKRREQGHQASRRARSHSWSPSWMRRPRPSCTTRASRSSTAT